MIEIINAYYNIPNPFKLFKHWKSKETTKLTKNNILILWGGDDIATEIYNEQPKHHYSPYKKSTRDKLEIALFNQAVELNIPIIGICRGAQLITALTGGKLVQHIENHDGTNHTINTYDGKTFSTNSYHHQMMQPTEESKLLAWATTTTGINSNGEFTTYEKVPELVYFPKVRALGIQGHIEWSSMPNNYFDYIENHIETLLLC